MLRVRFVFAILMVLAVSRANGAEPAATMTLRLDRPDQQCERILSLFAGARSPHPAAALAAWKRASRATLGKSTEALIAVLNPGMASELSLLDDTVVSLSFDSIDGHPRWQACLPRDDGTFASLATALVLTDGASEPPVNETAVDRLGPPGAPLMARTVDRLVLAGSRADLQAGLENPPSFQTTGSQSGLRIRIEPGALAQSCPMLVRRSNEAFRALGCRLIDGRLDLDADTLKLDLTTSLDNIPESAAIDPSWLKWLPAESAVAAISVAIEARPESWERAFALVDRVERVDPARAGLAPLRTRLNLAAAAVKVRPEVDLWPVLRGVSIGVYGNADGEVVSLLLALHTKDATAAKHLGETVLPRLLASFVSPVPEKDPSPVGQTVGRVGGRSLHLVQQGETVVVGWGEEILARALDARDNPARSVHGLLAADVVPSPPSRLGIFWPSRVQGIAGTTFASAQVPPVVWSGRNEGESTHDVVRWTELRGLVHRFLDRLPLDPPPAD